MGIILGRNRYLNLIEDGIIRPDASIRTHDP